MAFHLHRDGKAVEFALDELKAMAKRGELQQDEYVYDDTKGEWLGAALVPELEGAWDLEEAEATVAMELPPDFFDKFDEQQAGSAATALDGPTSRDAAAESAASAASVAPVASAASVAPAASSLSAAPSPAVPVESPSAPTEGAAQPEEDEEEATRAMDLSALEGVLSPSASEQEEATVAMDISALQLDTSPAPTPAAKQPLANAPRRPPPPSPPPQQQQTAAQRRTAARRRSTPVSSRPVNRRIGETASPVVAALLSFFTCGIYTMYWIWKRSEEVNAFIGKEELPRWVVPAMLVGTIVGAVPGLIVLVVWAFKLGEQVSAMAQGSRVQIGDRTIVYALCALFFPVLVFLAQQDLNETWKANGAATR